MLNKISQFDKYGRLEKPQLILCELSKEPLVALYALNVSLELNFIDISSIKFKIPKTINAEPYKHYNDVVELRLIYVKDIGYFQITSLTEQSDGVKEYKECEALSAQVMFQSKRITGIVGEFKLWNLINPYESLMGVLLTLAPSWKMGTVDDVFLTRQRSINITESDLYSIFTNDFYEAFDVIFVFDYDKYEINIYDAMKTVKDTEIFIDSHNVLKDYQIESQPDKIVTALRVIGGDGLDIAGINPNGTDTIYNVNAFKDRMSEGLRNALVAYEIKYNSFKQQYSDLLVELKNKNTELNLLQNNAPSYDVNYTFNQDGTAQISPDLTTVSGLSQLQGLRDNLEYARSVRIQNGNVPYMDINNYISIVESMIEFKKDEITTTENYISLLSTQISIITNQLKMENNFTSEQWIELNEYFRYDTIQENSFVITDIMSQDEKQQVRQELLEHGELILNKACYPTYIFKISSVNFLALPEFSKFQEEFELGATFTLKINDFYVVKPMLLGVRLNFDDLSDFELIFGNKTNVNDGFDFSAYKESVNVGAAISFDLVKIEAMKAQKNEITNFMNGALDIVKNNLFANTSNVEYLIDKTGLRLKQIDLNTEQLSGQEIWMTGNIIAFTKDNFTTSEMALGEIEAPGSLGGKTYGLIAPAIVGHLIAGNELHISNENNNFILNENGAFLDNASFTITKGANKIILDPTDGISISKNDSKKFYLDTNGNIVMEGTLTASTINGSTINGGNIYGASINIGNGRFNVDSFGNLTASNVNLSGYINATSGNFSGSINVNNRFTVDSLGNCYASSFNMNGGSIGLSYMQVDSSGRLQSQNGYFTNGYFSGDIYATSGYFNGILGSNAVYTGYISADQINGGIINGITINSSTLNSAYINGGTIYGAYITGTQSLSVQSANMDTLYVANLAMFAINRPTFNGVGLATLNDIYGVYSSVSTLGATLNTTSFDEVMNEQANNPDEYISIIKIMKEIIPQESSNIFIIWNGSPYFRTKGETTYYSIISKLDFKPIFDIPDLEIVKVMANDEYFIGDHNYLRDCISVEYFNRAIQPLINQYNKY